jgi:hypothetical protein
MKVVYANVITPAAFAAPRSNGTYHGWPAHDSGLPRATTLIMEEMGNFFLKME